MRPICVPCQLFFKPSKNGVYFIECMPTGRDAAPGIDEPHKWVPYKLWVGDEYRCPGCGARTIVGVPPSPICEHYHNNFSELVRAYGATFRVNDC